MLNDSHVHYYLKGYVPPRLRRGPASLRLRRSLHAYGPAPRAYHPPLPTPPLPITARPHLPSLAGPLSIDSDPGMGSIQPTPAL